MEIHKIDNRQITFNGRIDKSLKKHINKIVRKEIINSTINSQDKPFDIYKNIKLVLQQKKKILEKLNKFMSLFDKKTTLGVKDLGEPEQRLAGELFFSNPVTRKKIKIRSLYTSNTNKKDAWIENNDIFVKTDMFNRLTLTPRHPSRKDLDSLSTIIDAINSSIPADKIDIILATI